MQKLKNRDATDYYAMYRAGFYVNIDRTTGEFYWDRENLRYIISVDEAACQKARYIAKKEVKTSFDITLTTDPSGILKHLCDPKIKPNTWLNDEVCDVYRELFAKGYAIAIESRCNGDLVGGILAISIGRIITIDTMYGLPEPKSLRSASKALMCATICEMHKAGIRYVDVENEHPINHPCRRLGEQPVSIDHFRKLLNELGEGGNSYAATCFS